MSQREVSEFIVVAPASKGKAVQWAEHRLRSYLTGHFPLYTFRIEPFGPLSDDQDFAVVPIMNRRPEAGEQLSDPDELLMCAPLDPMVIPEIKNALRSFDLDGALTH